MQAPLDRVLRTIRTNELIRSGDRIVVALSGGSDSVALVHLLRDLAPVEGFALAGCAHFNHQLRGAAADADEAFCRDLAARLNLPIELDTSDVRTRARTTGTSLEVAARAARYAFLAEAAEHLGATSIAVGHTRDDQAETFVLKLLRGAGPQGLGGIYPRRGAIIRPLLDVSRSSLRAYLRSLGAGFCEDETNGDLTNPRNRVRHAVLPFLQASFSTGVPTVLAREAAIARDDADWLDRQAHLLAQRAAAFDDSRAEIDVDTLRTQPLALTRRVALLALRHVAGVKFVGFEHVEALMQLALASPGRGVDLPGLRAFRQGGRLVLTSTAAGDRVDRRRELFQYELRVPGEVHLDEAGCAISAERVDAAHPSVAGAVRLGGAVAVVESSSLAEPLGVRNRRPGDAFRPLGLAGRKKLQDFFVDRKIARQERDRVPLVVDARDRILWVVGRAVAEDFKVTAEARAVIILKAKRLAGGSG